MHDSQKSNQLQMRWVSVIGNDGRRHMEARWIRVAASAARPAGHAA
ncbi:hypothetical protein [Nocardioides sp. GY 10113]|nr:hypothetical protein [Nocardioides sp. GY 10113]